MNRIRRFAGHLGKEVTTYSASSSSSHRLAPASSLGSAHAMSSSSPSPDQEEVLSSVSRGVGTIILNRPKALNALTLGMVRSLGTIFHRWSADPEVS